MLCGVLCCVVLCCVVLCCVVLCCVSYTVTCSLMLFYFIWRFPITLFYHIISCRIISYLVMSCDIESYTFFMTLLSHKIHLLIPFHPPPHTPQVRLDTASSSESGGSGTGSGPGSNFFKAEWGRERERSRERDRDRDRERDREMGFSPMTSRWKRNEAKHFHTIWSLHFVLSYLHYWHVFSSYCVTISSSETIIEIVEDSKKHCIFIIFLHLKWSYLVTPW
jgi:hypothetical protein